MIHVWRLSDRELLIPWYHECDAHIVRGLVREGMTVTVAERDDERLDTAAAFCLEHLESGKPHGIAFDSAYPELHLADVAEAIDVLKPGSYPIIQVERTVVDTFTVPEEAGQ